MNTRLAYAKPAFVLGLAAMAAIPLLFTGASSPDGRPATPVTVEGTVSVQGVVEEINDVLRQPYNQQLSTSAASANPTVSFDIPDGKRLVVESVSFQASMPSGDANRMFLQPLVGSDRLLVPLAVQATSVEGATTYLIANHALTLRLDSVPGSTTELMIRRGNGGNGTLTVAVFGYLVDI